MTVARSVMITGAGDGLGAIAAQKFAAQGDRVFASDLSEEACRRLQRACKFTDITTLDVSRSADIDEYFLGLWRRVDRIDILINNVGIAGPRGPIESVDPQEWLHTFDANVHGAFWMIRAVLPRMKQHRFGVILNVSTASVKLLPSNRAPYVVSKAAVEALTLSVAREAGPYNVRCNAVRPGMMDNDRLNSVFARISTETGKPIPAIEEEALRYISMRSKVAMDDVAEMLVFLSSSNAAHVTGQVIAVDGDAQWEG